MHELRLRLQHILLIPPLKSSELVHQLNVHAFELIMRSALLTRHLLVLRQLGKQRLQLNRTTTGGTWPRPCF